MLCQPLQAALQAGNLLPELMCVLQVANSWIVSYEPGLPL